MSIDGDVHLDSGTDGGYEDGSDIESKHISPTAWTMESLSQSESMVSLGLSAEDPAGLYTYSRAYNLSSFSILAM